MRRIQFLPTLFYAKKCVLIKKKMKGRKMHIENISLCLPRETFWFQVTSENVTIRQTECLHISDGTYQQKVDEEREWKVTETSVAKARSFIYGPEGLNKIGRRYETKGSKQRAK